MRINHVKHGPFPQLILYPENERETRPIRAFARPDERLKVKLIKDPAYIYPTLIITKET